MLACGKGWASEHLALGSTSLSAQRRARARLLYPWAPSLENWRRLRASHRRLTSPWTRAESCPRPRCPVDIDGRASRGTSPVLGLTWRLSERIFANNWFGETRPLGRNLCHARSAARICRQASVVRRSVQSMADSPKGHGPVDDPWSHAPIWIKTSCRRPPTKVRVSALYVVQHWRAIFCIRTKYSVRNTYGSRFCSRRRALRQGSAVSSLSWPLALGMHGKYSTLSRLVGKPSQYE